MELMAAIEGLRVLKVPCRVRLVSDSQYLKKGITTYLPKWRSNGWVKSDGEPVLNQDLWDQLDQIAQKHEIQWEWIAGHGDHADQNRADHGQALRHVGGFVSGLLSWPGSGRRRP